MEHNPEFKVFELASATDPIWYAYDSCAEWCARRGLRGLIGDPLPNLLDSRVVALINEDPEAFRIRVAQCAYALAMDGLNIPQI